MPVSLEQFEQLIAESEQRITEQIFRIALMEATGRDTSLALRSLEAFEGILLEYRRARAALTGMQRVGPPGEKADP